MARACLEAVAKAGLLAACIGALGGCGAVAAPSSGEDDAGEDADDWDYPNYPEDDASAGIELEGGPLMFDAGPDDSNAGEGDASGDACALRLPVYRWLNGATGEHFYTVDANEQPAGFALESPAAFYVDPAGAGTIPFYRCYSSALNRHVYTPSATCEGTAGFVVESILGYIGTDGCGNATTLYRLFDATSADHFYTASPVEADNAVTTYGYQLQDAYSVWSAP